MRVCTFGAGWNLPCCGACPADIDIAAPGNVGRRVAAVVHGGWLVNAGMSFYFTSATVHYITAVVCDSSQCRERLLLCVKQNRGFLSIF